MKKRDDIGLAPSARMVDIAGGDDVLGIQLEEDHVAVLGLQIRAHIGIEQPAADELPASRGPIRVDRAAVTGGDMTAILPCRLLEHRYGENGAALGTRPAGLPGHDRARSNPRQDIATASPQTLPPDRPLFFSLRPSGFWRFETILNAYAQ